MDNSDNFATLTFEDALRRVSEAAYETNAIVREPLVLNDESMGWLGSRDRRRMDVRFTVSAETQDIVKANIQLVCYAMQKVPDMKGLRADADGSAAVVIRLMYFADRGLRDG